MNHRQHSNLNLAPSQLSSFYFSFFSFPPIKSKMKHLSRKPLQSGNSLRFFDKTISTIFLRRVYSSPAAVSLCSVSSKIYCPAAWPSVDDRKTGRSLTTDSRIPDTPQ